MSLSKIPVEVVEDHIFKYLAWNDLLRLRRVSKGCRNLVQDYMKTEKGRERAPQIPVGPSITGDIPDFRTLTEINIPTTKIYFRNSYKKERKCENPNREIKAFVEKYGGKVKHLRLHEFSTHPLNTDADTTQLLQGLPNLERLSLDRLIIGHASSQHFPPMLPSSVFQNLKALDLHVVMLGIYHIVGMHESFTTWLTECRSLEKLRLFMKCVHHAMTMEMGRVLEALILAVEAGNQWKRIEFDVHFGWVDDRTVDAFQRLLATCSAKNVGVAGVHANWLRDRRPLQQRESIISSAITDLRVGEEASDLRHLKLDKLATLEISHAHVFMEVSSEIHGPEEKPWWSATLQTLILTLPSWRLNIELLFERLSGGHPLIALREVSLKFGNFENQRVLERLVHTAPNLKELTLVNWNGSPFALGRLLPRIQGLEKLSLVNCQRLNDTAFVGDDPNKPIFLELKNLRRLSVKNRRYPATGLTAHCFASVFRHMNLTHFEMYAEEFTVEFQERCNWMKLLLEGPFAESVQEIKWNDCRLHQVQDPELGEIGKAFRSFKML